MWSVWSKRVDVYLGSALVLVQRPNQPLWSYAPPATLPLGDVLAAVDEACLRRQTRPWRMRVYLSAALCPPVTFQLPAGVKRWEEVAAIAQAGAARVWGLQADPIAEIVCAMDTRQVGVAATLMAGPAQQIRNWAALHGGRLKDMQPLWALATQAKACRGRAVQALTVLEPDALTVIDTSSPVLRAASWVGQYTPSEARSLAGEWIAVQLEADAAALPRQRPAELVQSTLGVKFCASAQTGSRRWTDGPVSWADHWEIGA